MLQHDAASYDADARQRRGVTRLLFWTVSFIVGSFMFAYCWRLYVGPYRQFSAARALEQEKAAVYMLTDVCVNDVTRARLENYNDCERSKRILKQSVSSLAFYDLMDYLNVCHKGICTIGGINMTDSLWFIGRVVLVTAAAAYVLSFFGLISSRYAQQSAMYHIPMTSANDQLYAMMAAAAANAHRSSAHTAPPALNSGYSSSATDFCKPSWYANSAGDDDVLRTSPPTHGKHE